MDNFSDIILSAELVSLRKRISSLRINMNSLVNKETEYYEHHQHLINTMNEMMEMVNKGIIESRRIGKGR